MPKIKNIIIFIIIAAVFVAVYFIFIKKPPTSNTALVSSSTSASTNTATASTNAKNTTQDFLTLLLNVKNIKLDDSIFSDVAFSSLNGSHSITITQDGTEGRVNPFAPLGSDIVTPPTTPATGATGATPTVPPTTTP